MSELFPAAITEYLPRFAQVVATQKHVEFETFAKAVARHQFVVTFPAGGHRFASIIEDITDRKRAETELRRQATILSQLHDAVIVMDQDWRITFWNQGAERIFGYRAEEVLGETPDRFQTPTYLGITREELIRRLSHDGEAEAESIRISKDGRTVRVASRAILLRDLVGEQDTFIWVDRDITAHTEAEAAMRRAEAELVLVAQEHAAVEERQRLARELHDSVSQALYGIALGAHTVLTRLDSDRAGVLEAVNYVISLAQAGLDEMRALIFDLRPESVAMEGLVAALTKQAAALHASHEVEIELSLCDEPDAPLSIKEALYRIAQEALQNAIKHARTDRLSVWLRCQPDSLGLEVCDNGVGFDPQAFYPGHLGLRSMRERATSVGGTLEIVSAPDCGTQVRVHVPIPETRTAVQGEDAMTIPTPNAA
jgi:PAS domain S-box-containing protein